MNTLPSFLQNNNLRFIFFGGKGGVGKTTAAAATALYLTRQRPEERILVVSTDPAHSLGDSFDQAIGGQVVPIGGMDGLFALELDSERLLAEWKQECDPMIAQVADRGTYFDEEDINDFLLLTLPGLDEAMAIMQIVALAEEGQHDRVVVDTAPTGHTLRLLALPAQMKLWIQVMDRLMEKHRFIVRSLVGSYRPDEVDHWLVKMEQEIRHVASLLRDAGVTEFVPVTIPEEMAIYETERLVSALRKHPLAVRNLIINQVVNHRDRCPTCQQREKDQAGALAQIQKEFADLRLLTVPQLSHEVRGMEALTEFGQLLTGDRTAEGDKGLRVRLLDMVVRGRDQVRAWLDRLRKFGNFRSLRHTPPLPISLSLPSARFIMIGGKGGVGKTTTAAATALYLARQRPDQRILVFSTDPAHSVGDSFGQPVGAQVTPIEPYDNLYAYEIDAVQLWEDFKKELGRDQEQSFRDEVAGQMLDLIPPGLDELMALLGIMELAEEFDIFILDTAPTGHLIRFLETPELAQNWLHAAARMLLKYKSTVRLGKLAEAVVKYSRQVRTLRQQLVDSDQTEFIAVTIPEAMAVAESERLLRRLDGLNITCRQVLVNKVTQTCTEPRGVLSLSKGRSDSRCSHCTARRRQEQEIIQHLMAELPDLRLAQTPQLPHPVRGIEDLVEFGEMLYA
ncbi:MAG: ArsA family ATPase [Ardenticatenia bacterium]|nr:ArsA family ATPase [Ardenticatenia bacterium]